MLLNWPEVILGISAMWCVAAYIIAHNVYGARPEDQQLKKDVAELKTKMNALTLRNGFVK